MTGFIQDIEGNMHEVDDSIVQLLTGLSIDDEEVEEEDESSFKIWLVGEDGSYVPSKAVKQTKSIKAGIWEIVSTQQGYYFIPDKEAPKELITLPNLDIQDIVAELRQFWDMADEFEKLKITHKRGILLHGRAGTGKSSLLNIIANICVKEFNGLVFYVRHRNDLKALIDVASVELATLEKDRNIITIIEDIENLYSQDPAMLTAFLDGEDEIAHNVVLATTNHIGELDEILTRPSRFDHLIELDYPEESDRRAILKEKYNIVEGEELDLWVKKTEDLSMAAIKELIIGVKLFKNDFDVTLERLKGHNKLTSKTLVKSNKNKTGIGFGINN